MTADSFFIPSDRAVIIYHDRHENTTGRIAIIAPTFTPGLSYLGIACLQGGKWEFVNGPSIVHTKRVWLRLLQLDGGYCPSAAVIFDETYPLSRPTASPDHLIDLVTRKAVS